VACGLDGIANVGDLAAAALGWKGRIDLLVNNQCDARFRKPQPPISVTCSNRKSPASRPSRI
jgi:hypothetical protein